MMACMAYYINSGFGFIKAIFKRLVYVVCVAVHYPQW